MSVITSTHAAPDPEALVFTSPAGTPLRHGNFRRVWLPALVATGLVGIHVHEVRHGANRLVAHAEANLRVLMERTGHASSRATLIYLHSTDDRQRARAEAVAARARAEVNQANACSTGGTKEHERCC